MKSPLYQPESQQGQAREAIARHPPATSDKRDPHKGFKGLLVAAGAEILAPTNPYEVLRFKTCFGVGVVYRNAKGRETWNREAQAARAHLHDKLGSLAPVKKHGRKSGAGTHQALLARDGPDCFFCLNPLGQLKSVEHLVPVAHGGPNHISNKFLAHPGCNSAAGHLSAPEKIRIRETALIRKFSARWWWPWASRGR